MNEEIYDALNFPFEIDKIAIKKSIWIKELSKNESLQTKKIAILGGSTTNELKEQLKLFGLFGGLNFEFWESDYDRWYESAIFDNASLLTFKPDVIYLYTTIKNLDELPSADSNAYTVNSALGESLKKITTACEALADRFAKPIIINNYELPLYRTLGNLDKTLQQGRCRFIDSLNNKISEYINAQKSVYLCDINYLSSFLGLKNWYDERLWHAYKIAISFEASVYLAKELTNILNALFGKSKKCLVLDLDNTLWDGVIGDNGVDGINISKGDATGEAFLAFQKECLELSKKGVMLAIASKNDPANAIAGLNKEEMILKESSFASLAISWAPKNMGLAKIAQEINIGIDTLVLADDNPAERFMVGSSLPSVGIIKMPDSPSDYALTLDRCGFFESVTLLDDDISRNRFYTEDKARESAKAKFADYGEYLASLCMSANIYEMDEGSIERVTGLLNKTNQFNLTMRRSDVAEISNIYQSHSHLILCGKLGDRFGDNGLVSVLGGEVRNSTYYINWWVMSCRVFGRELEFAMFDTLVHSLEVRSVAKIIGTFVVGAKNQLVADLYSRLGFEKIGDNEFEFVIADYKDKNQHIRIEN